MSEDWRPVDDSELSPLGATHVGSERLCLKCGAPNNAATNTEDAESPQDGDVALCFYCGHVQLFDGEGHREMTPEEAEEIMADQRIIDAVEQIKILRLLYNVPVRE